MEDGKCYTSPVLSFSGFRSFVAAGHFGLVAGFACRANLNRCILKRRSRDGHLTTTLQKKKILNTNKFKSNKAHQIMAANVP